MSVNGDRRLGGAWTPRQWTKNALIYLGVCGALRVADALPARALLGLGRWLGRVAYVLLGARRRAAERALGRVLGVPNPARAARANFVTVGENLALTLLLRRPWLRAGDWVRVSPETQRLLDAALAEGRGVVFVSAHLGPYELLAATVAELGHRPAVVVRESYDPRLDPLLDAPRSSRGIEVIHRGCPGSSTRILRALRQGRPVGFLTDLGGRVKSAPTRLLGWEVETPIGPSSIALRARSPLLVGTLHPLRALSSRPRGRPPWFVLELSRVDAPDEPRLRQAVANELSRRIAAAHEHWLWMASGFPWLKSNRASPYTRGLSRAVPSSSGTPGNAPTWPQTRGRPRGRSADTADRP